MTVISLENYLSILGIGVGIGIFLSLICVMFGYVIDQILGFFKRA